jgi:hypothetical protein
MLLKTKDRCGKPRSQPGMLLKTKELFVISGNFIEKKGTYVSRLEWLEPHNCIS